MNAILKKNVIFVAPASIDIHYMMCVEHSHASCHKTYVVELEFGA